jgi:TonB family protein
MKRKKQAIVGYSSQHDNHIKEQYYGLITSVLIHSIIFILFFEFSVFKTKDNIKTYYIQFTQMGRQTFHAAGLSNESIKNKSHLSKAMKKEIVQIHRKEEVKDETPLIKNPPVKEDGSAIKTDAIESHEAVNVANISESDIKGNSESGIQGQVDLYQGGSMVGNSLHASLPCASGVIDTEFGSTGAPTFLKRQMPVYPIIARKLGKEGKVVLRLFINEKGQLKNIEVVEPAGYGFTESAVEAVKMSTFSPAHVNGTNVASKALLSIRFVLKRD